MTNRRAIFGIALVLLGLIFLGRTLDLFFFDFGDFIRIIIPLGIIGLGFWLIVRKRHKEAMGDEQTYNYDYSANQQASYAHSQTGPEAGQASADGRHDRTGAFTNVSAQAAESPGGGPSGRVRFAKTFGDMFIDCTGVNMENVEVSSSFGDLEIKVHGAVLNPGLNRMIVSGFLGDIRIMIPADMAVMIHANSTAGDAEALNKKVSGFGNTIEAQTQDYANADKKLFIAINTFIGDVRVLRI